MNETQKQIPLFDKTEAAIYVMMGLADPFQFSSTLLREEEWAEFPKPIKSHEESEAEFWSRQQQWQEVVGVKVKKRLAYHLSEKLKKIQK